VRYYKGNKLDQAPLGGLDMWLAFKFAFSTTSGGATGSLQYAKEVQKGSYFFVYGIKKPLADKYYGNVTVTYKPANGPAETKNKTMTWK